MRRPWGHGSWSKGGCALWQKIVEHGRYKSIKCVAELQFPRILDSLMEGSIRASRV